MIRSFKDKETEKVFKREFSKKLPQDIQRRAAMQLISIHVSKDVNDLSKPPANRLELPK
jgi:proteic killer suppression protein